ncbi:MAG: hypothetical protein AAGC55_06295 [Myxococcota bacterium]
MSSAPVSEDGYPFPVRLDSHRSGAQTEVADVTVSVVDKKVIEFRLHYPLNEKKKVSRYRLSLYLFVPAKLGINKHTYHSGDFYRDLQTYFSFDPPSSVVSQIAVDSGPGPLLSRIIRQSLELWPTPAPGRVERISGDLRLLGCIVGAHIQAAADSLAADIKMLGERTGAISEQSVIEIRAGVKGLLADLAVMVPRIRDLAVRLEDSLVPDVVQEVYRWVAAHITLTIEAECTRVVDYLDRDSELARRLADVRTSLVDVITAEQTEQFHAGYLRPLDGDPSTADYYNYRRRVVKEFVRSVLFLDVARGKDGRPIAEMAAAIAAGSAMLFSSIMLMLTQMRYGFYTTPFVLIIVFTYILKDRIKDWMKRYVLSKASPLHSDYSIELQDKRSGENIGRCRELFSFVSSSKLPRNVFESRHDEPKNIVEIQSKPEAIIRYDKRVALHSGRRLLRYPVSNSVQDVIRIDLSEILQRAKSSERPIRVYQPDRDVVDMVSSTNTYHLNMVLVERAKGAQEGTVIGRVRVVSNKDGIKRIEAV